MACVCTGIAGLIAGKSSVDSDSCLFHMCPQVPLPEAEASGYLVEIAQACDAPRKYVKQHVDKCRLIAFVVFKN
jgi:hypothetical protein